MVRRYQRKVTARKYKSYTEEQLKAAIVALQSGRMTLREASVQFKIPLGTLSNKMNNKHNQNIGHPTVLTNEEEIDIVQHMIVISEWGFPFDMFDLRICVRTLLDKQGRTVNMFQNNLPSCEWAHSFLKRHEADVTRRRCQNIKSVRASVSAASVSNYFDNLEKSLMNPDGTVVPPCNIFNYDETNLSDNPGSKKCIFKRGVKYPERIMDSTKSSTSIMFCGSASGSMLPAYVVYKADHLWNTWTEGGPKNVRYNRSKSGWFDSTCFSDWFECVFVTQTKHLAGRKVILGDNLSSHFTDVVLKLARDNNISFICLPPNSTHLLQPLDVAFYGPLKRMWRSILEDWKVKSAKKVKTIKKENFPRLLVRLYEKLYTGNDNIETSVNLVSGFRKCGICPLQKDVVLARLPDGQLHGQPEESDTTPKRGAVSDAVLEVLQRNRGVGDETEPKNKRRKKMNVEPGKSIAVEDLLDNTTAAPSGTSPTPSQLVEEVINVMQADAASNSSADNVNENHEDSEQSSDDDLPSDAVRSSIYICVGYFYIVEFPVKEGKLHYIGKVTHKGSDTICSMKFLRRFRSSKNKFVWPMNPDEVDDVDNHQVVVSLDLPVEGRRGELEFSAKQLAEFCNTLH